MKLNNILKLSLCLILLVIVTLIIPTNKVEASSRKSISKATISSISTQYYTGKSIKPSITVKYKGKKLKKNKDYKVSYSKNKNVGTAKVKITGKGKYKGTKTKTFKIAVSKVSGFSKKTVTTSSITLKWSKPKKSVTGYEIYMATSKNGKYSKIKTITSSKTTTYKKTGLKDNKTYYFKLRAYKTISKKKYYSSYTSKISVKTSKKQETKQKEEPQKSKSAPYDDYYDFGNDKAFTSYLVRNEEKEKLVAEQIKALMEKSEFNKKWGGTCRAVKDNTESESIRKKAEARNLLGSYNEANIEKLGSIETDCTLVITVYDVYTYDSTGKEATLSDCWIYYYEVF